MNSEVLLIHRNNRYKIITIHNAQYIFDLDRTFIGYLFPFLNWMKSHTVYKITNESDLEKLRVDTSNTKVGFGLAIFMGGLSIFFANLIGLIIDRFEINTPDFINYILLILSLAIVICYRIQRSRKNKEKISGIIKIDQLEKGKLRIRPQSFKHFGLVLFLYLILISLSLGSMIMFIQFNNYLIFLIAILLFTFILFMNNATLAPGKNKIRMK
jgi:uncharacterized membrane protein (TIGR01218 family)